MRFWWFIFITVHLVCGKSESFKEINESDIKRETSDNNDDQGEVEKNLMSNPDYNFTRRKKSLEGEEREKKQQQFHSWGGKRYEDKDEEEKEEGADEANGLEYDDIERGTTHVINQLLPGNFVKEENMFPNMPSRVFEDLPGNVTPENKRDPEIIYDVRKRADFYDSILQQVGFHPELSEQNSKRYPAFNSWAGKRSTAFNSWGGKRDAAFKSWEGKRAAPFNSWGGKRAAPFNSWGGKRNAAFNSWGGKRNAAFNSWGGKREAAFNSWGGKRAVPFNSWRGKKDAVFNSWEGKGEAILNSWGRKRAAELNNWGGKGVAAFNSWGGKRDAAFNSWGGKRAAPFISWGGKRTAAFNSWGGKRDFEDLDNWEKEKGAGRHNNIDQEKGLDERTNFIGRLLDEKHYDTTNTMNYNTENMNEKRSAAFNSWGGKRMPALDSWAGKRIAAMNKPGGKKSAAFNSWGGKRATSTSFNSWGGKRGTSFNSCVGKRTTAIYPYVIKNSEDVQDTSNHEMSDETLGTDHDAEFQFTGVNSNNELLHNLVSHLHGIEPNSEGFNNKYGKVNKFNGPGNKHSRNNIKVENGFRGQEDRCGLSYDASEKQMKKRSSPAFSSWAGKRAPLFSPWYTNKMPSLLISSGKRRPAFSSWGGKRSELKPLQETGCSRSNECPDLADNNVAQSDEKQNVGVLREKREVNCSSEEGISASGVAGGRICSNKKLDGDLKKSRIMTRMLFQGGFSRPMAIKSLSRGLDFYAWGGKRSL